MTLESFSGKTSCHCDHSSLGGKARTHHENTDLIWRCLLLTTIVWGTIRKRHNEGQLVFVCCANRRDDAEQGHNVLHQENFLHSSTSWFQHSCCSPSLHCTTLETQRCLSAIVFWRKPCTTRPVRTMPPGVQYGNPFQWIPHHDWACLNSGSASFVVSQATKGTISWWRHRRSLLLADPDP